MTLHDDTFDRLAAAGCLYVYSSETLKRINKLVSKRKIILDLGCGDGTIGAALDAGMIIGLERSKRCAQIAHSRGISCILADAKQVHLPFADHIFDTVLCVDVLHHLGPPWKDLLGELARVLATDGNVVIIEPDARNPLVRLTQAPHSWLRVAPCENEPAIHPNDLLTPLHDLGFTCSCQPFHLDGKQVVRDVFPLWQRILKAPFIICLTFLFGKRPNKFAIIATRKKRTET